MSSAASRTGIPTANYLEAKHGCPMEEIVGTIYVLCFDVPTRVRSVSTDYPVDGMLRGGFVSKPIRHYVGWTQRSEPTRRIYQHGGGTKKALVSLSRGTIVDEGWVKESGRCPKCGGSLLPGS